MRTAITTLATLALVVAFVFVAKVRKDFNAQLYNGEVLAAQEAILYLSKLGGAADQEELLRRLLSKLPDAEVDISANDRSVDVVARYPEPQLLPVARAIFGDTPSAKLRVSATLNGENIAVVSASEPFELGKRVY